MEVSEIEFIRSTKRVGLGRAQEILALLAAYEGNATITKKVVGKKQTAEAFEPITETLTKGEVKLLDQALKLTHKSKGEHLPILEGAGFIKPNMSAEIVSFYKENPGLTRAEGAEYLADKFSEHYVSAEEGKRKIMSIICNLAYSKGSQKALRAEGGRRGRGNPARIYAL